MKAKYWLLGWALTAAAGLGVIGAFVYKIDPYMHFHQPDTSAYFYNLNNQRSQNDGIIRHFEYDALITGTSMTENFRTSVMNAIFGCNAIKVPYSGGSYKEINDALKVAIRNNPELRTVVRCLDMEKFFQDKDTMRTDLGKFPTYLYDENPLNDVQYLWNRDVIWSRAYAMTESNNRKGFKPGITSFDDYSSWQKRYTFGKNVVCPEGIADALPEQTTHLTEEQRKTITENIEQNVTSLAKEHPEITFYYFFSPYSAAYWKTLGSDLTRQTEAEQLIIELILECDNIRLFSFNNRLDITCDLNNYKDSLHYGQWINDLILRWMHDGEYELTKDNYLAYLQEERQNYLNMDYAALSSQPDYESDFYAAALLNRELTGAEPLDLLADRADSFQLKSASITEDPAGNGPVLDCIGRMERNAKSEGTVFSCIYEGDYVGGCIEIEKIDKYGYLTFYGRKVAGHGQPAVYVANKKGKSVGELSYHYSKIDEEWHLYVIDVSDLNGSVRIMFNGGYYDSTGSPSSEYMFRDIVLY